MSATASFLDNPLLKVSRPVAACSRCRTAKIKCDGKLPACSACEKVGKARTCSGATDEFAKGKERSYVASLEGYCERLQKQIAQIRCQQRTGAIRESSITSISSAGSVAKAHQKEVSDIDDLVGDFGFLSVNATSRDFHGIESSTSFANLLLTFSVAVPLPKPSPHTLPPRHEALRLLQYYFDHIFVCMPFFIETKFWTSVDSVYQSGGRFAKPLDHWFLYLVLAISSASLSHQYDDEDHRRALSLVSAALQYAEDVLRPGSVAGIQALLLLVQYAVVDPKHFRSWYLIGMTVRVMVDLGLHQDPPAEVETDSHRLSIRRRVFHSIYCLERAISVALGRAFSFSDDSVSVALPNDYAPSNRPIEEQSILLLHNLAPASHIIKIRRILSAAYYTMQYSGREPLPQPLSSTWSWCAMVREWLDSCLSSASHHFSLLYRLESLYTTIIILSPSHGYPTICDYNRVLLFAHCIDYISQLHQALENPRSFPFLSYTDIQRAHQVGRLFVQSLDQAFNLLLSRSVPVPPPVPSGAPAPPYLAPEDRIDCVGRSIRCLDYIRDLLEYGIRKWDIHEPLTEFEALSVPIRERLRQTQSHNLIPGTSWYLPS